ncbi:hypothetical protein L1887_20188 [Cichorium endivia]|nr:hypothetical protein L1887_20188 [Cichorium endivia]
MRNSGRYPPSPMTNSMNSRSVQSPSPSSPIFFRSILLIKADRETYRKRAAKGGERFNPVENNSYISNSKFDQLIQWTNRCDYSAYCLLIPVQIHIRSGLLKLNSWSYSSLFYVRFYSSNNLGSSPTALPSAIVILFG